MRKVTVSKSFNRFLQFIDTKYLINLKRYRRLIYANFIAILQRKDEIQNFLSKPYDFVYLHNKSKYKFGGYVRLFENKKQ